MGSNPQKSTKENSNAHRMPEKKTPTRRSRYEQHLLQRRRKRSLLTILAVIGVALLGLGMVYFLNNGSGKSGNNLAGQYQFQVGSPRPGEQAPAMTLSATDGSTFDLASMQGKTVLLYFQEGLSCQPCWDQLKDIQNNLGQFRALGITSVVSITSDPLDALKQKVRTRQ